MTDKIKTGWHEADRWTRVQFDKHGEPVRIETTRSNFDKALDSAAQLVGEPLEHGNFENEGRGMWSASLERGGRTIDDD